MSVKHVKEYYLKVTDDYKEMKKALELLEKIGSSSANVEVIKQQVEKLQENYMRIAYIIYLLNMPNKKEKKKSYVKREGNNIKKLVKYKDTSDGVLEENKTALSTISSMVGKN